MRKIARMLAVALALPMGEAAAQQGRLAVPLVTDEADAVLAILATRAGGRAPTEQEWRRLFSSEGYVRLQRREASLGRAFEDSAFRAFVLSPELAAREPALRATLEAWKRVDLAAAANRAFDYLPPEATIRAKIYPVIKPRTNSFVFEPRTDPAIFLYLNPEMTAAQFENTVAHELHHIGVGGACRAEPQDSTLAEGVRNALTWMGGFAEGRAVLAAAGSPDVHPHATNGPGERGVWERDFAHVERDMRRLEAFFADVLDGRLGEEERTRRGMSFVATDSVPQGPFYTVGWLMSATVERQLGRARLIASLCDPRMFLADYNRAAAMHNRTAEMPLPRWSGALLRRIGAPDEMLVGRSWRMRSGGRALSRARTRRCRCGSGPGG